MAENVKIVAEFQDNATAGIKKLNEELGKVGKSESGKFNFSEMGDSLKDLGEQLKSLGTGGGTDAIAGIGRAAAGAATSLGGLGAGAAVAVGIVASIGAAALGAAIGLEAIASGARAAADDAAEMADKLGISMLKLETLKIVADENGTSVEGLTRTFDKLSKSLSKFDDDNEATEYAFASLGLTIEELAGKSETEVAGIIIKNWEDLGRSNKATAATMTILGGSFREQIPAIKEMSTNLGEYERRAKEFGAEASANIIKQGGEQERAITDLGLAWKGLSNEIAEWAGTMKITITNWAASLIKGLRDVLVEMRIFRNNATKIEAIPQDRRNALLKQATKDSDAAGDGTAGDVNKRFKALLAAETAGNDENQDREFGLRNVESNRIAALKGKSEAAKKPTKGGGGGAAKNEYASALEDMKRALAVSKETTVEEKTLFETQSGRFKNFTAGQKEVLLGLARQTDIRNKQLKIEEELKAKHDAATKAMAQSQEADEARLALAEYELTLTGMTTDERRKLLDVRKEELSFQKESKDLTATELAAAKIKEADFARRREDLRVASKDALTINNIMDGSKARIQDNVTDNLMTAAKLLENGKITVDDYVKYQDTQLERLGMKNEKVADEFTVFWEQAARNVQDAMSNFFFDIMQGKMDNLADGFKQMLDRMVANALAAKLAETLFGSGFGSGKSGSTAVGGLVGEGLSWLGSNFGGARASGGPVTPGKVYMVGEHGPEPFIPSTPGTIMPNSSMGASAPVYQINITAMDTQGVRSALEPNLRWLTDAVNKTGTAYNMKRV